MSGEIPKPGSFTIDNPARLALDLPGTTDNLRVKNINVGVGGVHNISAVEAGDRTRVVISMARLITYQTRVEGTNIVVSLGGSATSTAASGATASKTSFQAEGATGNTVGRVVRVAWSLSSPIQILPWICNDVAIR